MDPQSIPPQPPQVKPVVSPPKIKLPIILVIILFLLLVVVGVTAYYLRTKQTKTQTNIAPTLISISGASTISKKTIVPTSVVRTKNNETFMENNTSSLSSIFKNDKFGIKITYEKNQDYEITVKDQYIKGNVTPPIDYDQNIEVRITPLRPRGLDFGWAAINFYIQNNNLNFNLEDFKNQENYIKSKFFWGGETLSFNSKEKNNKWGNDVYKLTTPIELGGAYRVLYLLIHNNNLIVIEDYINNGSTKEEFDKILSPILNNLSFY